MARAEGERLGEAIAAWIAAVVRRAPLVLLLAAAGTLLCHEKRSTSDAFTRFANPAGEAVGLPVMEVAQDLLKRWKTLAPEKRSGIAAKLLESQGITVQPNMSKRAFDQEMHRQIAEVAGHPAIAAAMRFADHSGDDAGRRGAEKSAEERRAGGGP